MVKILSFLFIVFIQIINSQEKKFELIDPNYSGIHFNNIVQDKKEHNILLYANYYGGGGVGIADFDNDGLQDIYLTGNLVGDKIYRNFHWKSKIRLDDGIDETIGWIKYNLKELNKYPNYYIHKK